METTFGERIRQLRNDSDLTQRDLADRVAKALRDREEGRGFDFTYLSKIENGKLPPPSTVVIFQLARELKADCDELLGLAQKVHPEVQEVFKKSEPARVFFRSAVDMKLSGADWEALLEDMKRRKQNFGNP